MNIYLDSIGCRLNQSEIENFARQFVAAGHSLVGTMDEADMMVLNTCTVTAPAASDSRQKIRQARRAGVKEIIVTGCWSTIEEETARNTPGVTRVIPNESKDRLVYEVLDLLDFDLEPTARTPIPGSRLRTRAFIKAQDGCDNHCTFCITTIARGNSRSISIEDVVRDVETALEGDAREIVLTGVHLGSWGQDISPEYHLKTLVRELLKIKAIPRLRLSSLEPWDLNEDFFSLWEDSRLCPHLHLPLQSGCDETLKRMGRKITSSEFAQLIEAARKMIPDVAITTDIIAGFPGETDEEFKESLNFVREIGFADGHVFTYSERPGTAATRFQGQVHNHLRKERSGIIRNLLETSRQEYLSGFLGSTREVLWESARKVENDLWEMQGLTKNYITVSSIHLDSLWNTIWLTKLTELNENKMLGEVIKPL
ncbi:MAG: MiaB/RimO family radical SAM methylthiotransferase [Anaerolineales bacterium]|nr:MiaB/RimO family radical SAM methylthiotransferase [Anaerolineales bacterium]